MASQHQHSNLSDVFISYARADRDFVERLEQTFHQDQYDVWVDWQDIKPSTDWWKAIRSAIDMAKTFVFVITEKSLQSKACYAEIEYAVKYGKRIVPILREEIKTPGLMDKMHPEISAQNWIYMRESDHFRRAYLRLRHTLLTDMDHVSMHTRMLVFAKEWKRSGKSNSSLLRGADLDNAENWLVNAFTQQPAPIDVQVAFIRASRSAVWRERRLLGTVAVAVLMIMVGAIFVLFSASESANRAASTRLEILNQQATSDAFLVALESTGQFANQAAVNLGATADAIVETQSAIVIQQTSENLASESTRVAVGAQATAQAKINNLQATAASEIDALNSQLAIQQSSLNAVQADLVDRQTVIVELCAIEAALTTGRTRPECEAVCQAVYGQACTGLTVGADEYMFVDANQFMMLTVLDADQTPLAIHVIDPLTNMQRLAVEEDFGTIIESTVDFGDGNTILVQGGALTDLYTHTYAESGTYTITYTVTSDTGNTASTSREFDVRAMRAAFSRSWETATRKYTFYDDSVGEIDTATWEILDGEQALTFEVDRRRNAFVEFPQDGIYEVRLTVSDAQGNTDTTSKSVTVQIDNDLEVRADFAFDASTNSVTVTDRTLFPEPFVEWRIDYGDGSPIYVSDVPPQGVMHTYQNGMYTLTYAGVTADGDTAQRQQSISFPQIVISPYANPSPDDAMVYTFGADVQNLPVNADLIYTWMVVDPEEWWYSSSGVIYSNFTSAVNPQTIRFADAGEYVFILDVAMGKEKIANTELVFVVGDVTSLTATLTVTPTGTPTDTPDGTPEVTITPCEGECPTVTPTGTPTVTPTGTPTEAPTETTTQTSVVTPTGTADLTSTGTLTETLTPTPDVTPTSSLTITPSPTRTPCEGECPTSTPTFTPSMTATIGMTPTELGQSTPVATSEPPVQGELENPTQAPPVSPTVTPTPV